VEIRLRSRYGHDNRQLIEIGRHDLISPPCHGSPGKYTLPWEDLRYPAAAVFQLFDLYAIADRDTSGVSLLDASP